MNGPLADSNTANTDTALAMDSSSIEGPASAETISLSGSWQEARRTVEVIMFTDIKGSVGVQEAIGTTRYAALLKRHDSLFAQSMREAPAGEIIKHTGDGFLAIFEHPGDAVNVALRFQWLLTHEPWPEDGKIRVRIGIHQGEVLLMPPSKDGPGTIGGAVNLAARVMALADESQILMTRAVFDDSRQVIRGVLNVPEQAGAVLRWEAHGAYLLRGIDRPIEVFETGVRDLASFRKPHGGPDTQRSVSADEEATLGWRPAASMEVPLRSAWRLQHRLGEGGFGEVWLAKNQQTKGTRVFKFCFDAVRLRSFKRELALFRLIRERLGMRDDIASLYEVQLDHPPFFLESEFCEGGTLKDWIDRRVAAGNPPSLKERLDVVIRLARTIGAAHSLGIIHKDIKPSNVFMDVGDDGVATPKLADFGIGVVVDPAVFEGMDIRFSQSLTLTADRSRTGTRLYAAPEYMVGKPPSILGDIYSLGVLLYQIVVGDFDKPLGIGWQRDITDNLLCEDIENCVDVEPSRRFASAALLADGLATLDLRREQKEAAALQLRKEQERLIELAQSRRRIRLASVGLAVTVCLLAAATVVALLLGKSQHEALRYAGDLKTQSDALALQKERTEDQLYISEMFSASSEIIERRGGSGRLLVEAHRPVPGGKDRRGWEWYFARALLEPTQQLCEASHQPLRCLALSPNGQQVALSGDDGMISVWKTDPLKKVREWKAADSVITDLSWNNDGFLAASGGDGNIGIWAANEGIKTTQWKAHNGRVNCAKWCPTDPKCLVSGGDDKMVNFWTAEGKLKLSKQVRSPVHAIGWRENGAEIAVEVSNPAGVMVQNPWSTASPSEVSLDGPLSPLAWRPGRREIALAKDGYPLRSWIPATDRDGFWMWTAFSAGTSALAWSFDGGYIAHGGVDGKILIVDTKKLKESRNPLLAHRGAVVGLAWSGEKLISAGVDGTVRKWEVLRNSEEIRRVTVDGPIASSAWNPVDETLAILVGTDEVQVWDARTWRLAWAAPLPQPGCSGEAQGSGTVFWSPNGSTVSVVAPRYGVASWNGKDGAVQASWALKGARNAFYSHDSTALYACANGIWHELHNAGEVRLADDLKDRAFIVELANIGKAAVTVSSQRLHLAPFSSAILPDGPSDFFGEITVAKVSRDGRWLAIGSNDGAVLWFDSSKSEWFRPTHSHSGPVRDVAWSPDNSRLVTVGADGVCRVFHVALAAPSWLLIPKFQQRPTGVGWSADGTKIQVTAEYEPDLYVFDATNGWQLEGAAPTVVTKADLWSGIKQSLEEDPGSFDGWDALEAMIHEEKGGAEADERRDLLLAACHRAKYHLSASSANWSGSNHAALGEWNSHPLPQAALVAQWEILGNWEEVMRCCERAVREQSAGAGRRSWFELAAANALEKLARGDESRARWQRAWESIAAEHLVPKPDAVLEVARNGAVDLTPATLLTTRSDWRDNGITLAALPPDLVANDGVAFNSDRIVQLASRNCRSRHERMFPRVTPLFRLNSACTKVSLLLGSIADAHEAPAGACVGRVFLHHQNGGMSSLPLVYGENIWAWRVKETAGDPNSPQEAAVAWKSGNHAGALVLYRIDWKVPPGAAPVDSLAFASTMTDVSPFIAGVTCRP